jgi:hypothetical protein
MPGFVQDAIAIGQDGFQSSATQAHPLGTKGITKDGRVFRYSQAGASDLVAGNVIQSAAPIANHLALTAVAAAVGTTVITVTPGNTAGAANLYAEGVLNVDTSPNNGTAYRIKGHPAITASTAFTLTLADDDAIQVAWTSATRYGLIHNPYKNVIQTPTTLTAAVAGVAGYIITAAQFGWIQTWGPASVLINGTPAVGVMVMNGATTAGSVDVITTTNLVTSNVVGKMMQVGVSTKNNLVWLTIGE